MANDTFNQARLRRVNDRPANPRGEYVLYWMQIARRLDHNHALNYALACAAHYRKPLVIYEGLKLGYPWASARLHRFILEGMRDNARKAAELDLNYWPFVETPDSPGRGLVHRLAAKSVIAVTEDYPCFIVPEQTEALAARSAVSVVAVDANSIVPLSLLGAPVAAAAHLRPRIHKAFAQGWAHRAGQRGRVDPNARQRLDPPFEVWNPSVDLDSFVAGLPIDPRVRPVASVPGGSNSAKTRLIGFIRRRLPGYAAARSAPASPEEGHASGLSPYLHFGHISIEQVVEKALASVDWTVEQLNPAHSGKRDGFYCDNADVNSFLDEAVTWRDVGFNWHRGRRQHTATLDQALPDWARKTLADHLSDPREFEYSLEEWESAATHDPLWNAAQRELVMTGTIHNYLRMLWGKKVLEWSKTPEEAYRVLVHLNNKYALDGRDPNSYTGILWCFGLFDRPWPERKVFGKVRFMSSDNTARKFDVEPYLQYVSKLVANH